MGFWKRTVMALVLVAMASGQVMAGQGNYEESRQTQAAVLDAVVARPVGIVVTGVGALLFVVSLPFSALGGNVGEAAEMLVMKPARETFTRCLGCNSVERKSAAADLK